MSIVTLSLVHLLAQNPNAKAEVLPLTRLRLYETGVAYFERRGKMRGGKSTELPLPAGHIDDALKTLVVLDDPDSPGAVVDGVAFSTAVSRGSARALAGLPLDGEAPISYRDILASLEGVDVVVDTKKSGQLRGRLVDVQGPFAETVTTSEKGQTASKTSNDPVEPQYSLLVLDEDKGVVRIGTRDIRGVRPVDEAMSERLALAANALSDRAAQTQLPLSLQLSKGGAVALGYIAETPVWRTTYRIVLPKDDTGATLQGWALIHNDTDEDWTKISVELVNGQPTSFLYPLAAPRYAWRELAEPSEQLATVAQLTTTTPDRLWGDNVEAAYGVGGLGLVGTGRGGGGTGEGTIGLGSIGTIGKGAGGGLLGTEPVLGDLAKFAQADGTEAGAQFIYRIANPIDLEAHHSALVPVVQADVDAEAITWFSTGDETGYSAVRLVNSTKQTLPMGTVSFFADGGFAGESALDRLKPNDQRFIMFGRELDVELQRAERREGAQTRKVFFDGNQIVEHTIERREITLDAHNRSGSARTVYAALDVPRNAKISGAPELDFDKESQTPLVVLRMNAGDESEVRLKVEQVGRARHAVTRELLERLAKRNELPKASRDAISAAARAAAAAERKREEITTLETSIRRETEDLERLRESVRSLKLAKADVSKRLTKKIAQLEKSIAESQLTRVTASEALEKLDQRHRDALEQLKPR